MDNNNYCVLKLFFEAIPITDSILIDLLYQLIYSKV